MCHFISGYLLSRGDTNRGFTLPVNLGCTLLRNLLVLLDKYTNESESLMSVFQLRFASQDAELIKKVTSQLIEHTSYKVDSNIIASVQDGKQYPLNYTLGTGQKLDCAFYEKLFSCSEYKDNFVSEDEFWDSISEPAISATLKNKNMLYMIYDL